MRIEVRLNDTYLAEQWFPGKTMEHVVEKPEDTMSYHIIQCLANNPGHYGAVLCLQSSFSDRWHLVEKGDWIIYASGSGVALKVVSAPDFDRDYEAV
jgi:hypothetical protein